MNTNPIRIQLVIFPFLTTLACDVSQLISELKILIISRSPIKSWLWSHVFDVLHIQSQVLLQSLIMDTRSRCLMVLPLVTPWLQMMRETRSVTPSGYIPISMIRVLAGRSSLNSTRVNTASTSSLHMVFWNKLSIFC